jgi:hypothetical protein
MVTGRPPFAGDDALAVAVQHLQDEPPPASTLNPAIPLYWDALLRKALAKDPARGVARHRWALAGAGLAAVLVVALLAVRPQAATARRPATLGATIGAYLSGLAARQQFSGSVLVARHGTAAPEQGYGLADRLYHRPNTPATTYPVFGVSDSFSVLGALQLIQRGKLAWQTPICRYLASCPEAGRPSPCACCWMALPLCPITPTTRSLRPRRTLLQTARACHWAASLDRPSATRIALPWASVQLVLDCHGREPTGQQQAEEPAQEQEAARHRLLLPQRVWRRQ